MSQAVNRTQSLLIVLYELSVRCQDKKHKELLLASSKKSVAADFEKKESTSDNSDNFYPEILQTFHFNGLKFRHSELLAIEAVFCTHRIMINLSGLNFVFLQKMFH